MADSKKKTEKAPQFDLVVTVPPDAGPAMADRLVSRLKAQGYVSMGEGRWGASSDAVMAKKDKARQRYLARLSEMHPAEMLEPHTHPAR